MKLIFTNREPISHQKKKNEAGFQAARTEVIDLEYPLPNPSETDSRNTYALIRIGTKPIGSMTLDKYSTVAENAAAIWDELGAEISAHLVDAGRPAIDRLDPEGIGPDENPPSVTEQRPTVAVVIATHNRPTELETCLDSMANLTLAPDELIVVDNAPSDDLAEKTVQAWNTRNDLTAVYLREPTAGLAIAHNTGMEIVSSELAAFADDDVIVDPYWLEGLVAGFEQYPNAGAVTGMILASELETWPQYWAETGIGFNKGFEQRVFDLHKHRPDDPLFPYAAGAMGSGANMAFRTTTLRSIGGFNPALGAGTPAQGGDDLQALYRVVTIGQAVVYQPSSVIFHRHHPTLDGLRSQSKGYGVGLTAYLTSLIVDDPTNGLKMLWRAARGIRHLAQVAKPPGENQDVGGKDAASVTRAQRIGMLRGPLAYARSRRRSSCEP